MIKRKSTKKASSKKVILRKLKKLFSSRPFIILSGITLGIAALAILFTPAEYSEALHSPKAYSIEMKDDQSIELGTEKTIQEGENGVRVVTYKYYQTLFDKLLGKDIDVTSKEAVAEVVVAHPKSKVVLQGTRKWQYMMCSNGAYIYYTNDQFKNRNTGFTSKSADDCAAKGNGKMVRLADSPNGTSNNKTPSYVPPNCGVVETPYKTVYKDASWLYVGEAQEGYGLNGYGYACSNGKRETISAPTDKIIYRGTRERQSVTTTQEPTRTRDYAAKAKCDGDYSRAKAQLQMAGATNSSVMDQINQLHTSCLYKAGF